MKCRTFRSIVRGLTAALIAVLAHATAGTAQSTAANAKPSREDSAAIRAAALDYVEGWYTANADRMRNAVHPDLAKRIVSGNGTNDRVENMTAEQLIRATGMNRNTIPEAQQVKNIKILDIYGNTASVRAEMAGWFDYMQLGRVNGKWVIINVLWVLKPPA